MRKITTFLMSFMVALGFAQQVVVQDFEAETNNAGDEIFGEFGGLATSLTEDPTEGTNQTGEIVETAGGEIWKGIFVRPQTNYIDLTSNQDISIDVYADSQTYFKGIIQDGQDGQTTIELTSAEEHTGTGWETLTFTFTGATGEWGEFAMRANVDASGGLVDPATEEITTYLDNLTANQGTAIPEPAQPGDELVTNGDFETIPDASWYGNAFNIVVQGDNQLNEANIQAAGNPFDVNLSQVVELQDGNTYELSFDAFTDETTGSRTILAGLGQTGAPFAALTQTTTLTSTSQTFTYQFTINYGNGVDDRVIFDMGAEVGFVFIDNVSVTEVTTTCNNGVQDGDETGVDCGGSCDPCPAVPTVAAPTPPNRPENDVISIFSDAYTNISVDSFDTSWCPGNTSDITIEGNATKQISDLGCEGIEWQSARTVDASEMTHFHIDVWTETETLDKSLNFKFSNWNGGTEEANAIEFSLTNASTPSLPNPNPGTWISLDIPLSEWGIAGGGSSAINDIVQFIITSDLGTIYYDNLYLHKNTTLNNTTFAQSKFSVYPNPSSGIWTIESEVEMTSVQLYNILGKLVAKQTIEGKQASISTEGLASGVYFAKVSNGKENTKTLRLVKN